MVSTNDRIRQLEDEIKSLKSRATDPLRSFKFQVEFGEALEGVLEIPVLASAIIGIMTVSDLVDSRLVEGPKICEFTRGVFECDSRLAEWYQDYPEARRDITIKVGRHPVVAFDEGDVIPYRIELPPLEFAKAVTLKGCIPVDFRFGPLDAGAGSNSLWLEHLTVQYDSLEY